MQILSTTPLAALVMLVLVVLGAARGIWALVLTLPLGASAAVTLPGLGSLSLTEAGVIGLWLSLLLRARSGQQMLGTLRPGQPGFILMLLIVAVSLSALFAPRLMAGQTEVVALVRLAEGAVIAQVPLAPGPGNLGQLARFVLAASACVALARVFRHPQNGGAQAVLRAMALATALHVALTLGDLAWPQAVAALRTAQMAMLDEQAFMGLRRLVGGFPEASAFSYFTIGLYGFWLRGWIGGVPGAGLATGAMLALLLRSTASSAYVCLAVVTGLVLLWHLSGLMRRGTGWRLYAGAMVALPMLAGACGLALTTVPTLSALADSLLWSKLDSASGVERMGWNLQALRNAQDTWGLGAGLGSLRASSWLAASLGTLGLPGTALFVWFIIAVLRCRPVAEGQCGDARRAVVIGALQTGCVAVLVQAMLTRPHPNLGLAFFVMAGLAVGLARQGAMSGGLRAPALRPDERTGYA